MNKKRQHLINVVLLILISTLSACDGGLFGTGDGEVIDALGTPATGAPEDVEPTPGGDPQMQTPDAPPATAPGDVSPGSDLLLSISFSNTMPSGLDPLDGTVPALKVINLATVDLTASSVSVGAEGAIAVNTVSITAQETSSAIAVNTGASIVNVVDQITGEERVIVDPLNASADSLTSLIISEIDNNVLSGSERNFSVLALDTRAIPATASVSELRVVHLDSTASASRPHILFEPVGENPNGAELVVEPEDSRPHATSYTIASAGRYTLAASDNSFTAIPITLEAGSVYTFILTGNPLTPLYVERDNLQ